MAFEWSGHLVALLTQAQDWNNLEKNQSFERFSKKSKINETHSFLPEFAFFNKNFFLCMLPIKAALFRRRMESASPVAARPDFKRERERENMMHLPWNIFDFGRFPCVQNARFDLLVPGRWRVKLSRFSLEEKLFFMYYEFEI